jgi:hypothetical protein
MSVHSCATAQMGPQHLIVINLCCYFDLWLSARLVRELIDNGWHMTCWFVTHLCPKRNTRGSISKGGGGGLKETPTDVLPSRFLIGSPWYKTV